MTFPYLFTPEINLMSLLNSFWRLLCNGSSTIALSQVNLFLVFSSLLTMPRKNSWKKILAAKKQLVASMLLVVGITARQTDRTVEDGLIKITAIDLMSNMTEEDGLFKNTANIDTRNYKMKWHKKFIYIYQSAKFVTLKNLSEKKRSPTHSTCNRTAETEVNCLSIIIHVQSNILIRIFATHLDY